MDDWFYYNTIYYIPIEYQSFHHRFFFFFLILLLWRFYYSMEEYDEGWGHIFIYVPRWNDVCCTVCDLIQPIIGYLQNWRYVTEFLCAFFRTMEPSQITILFYRFVEKRDCVMAITMITASYCTYIMHTTLPMDVYYPNVYISVDMCNSKQCSLETKIQGMCDTFFSGFLCLPLKWLPFNYRQAFYNSEFSHMIMLYCKCQQSSTTQWTRVCHWR